jgi:hypothetical protein
MTFTNDFPCGRSQIFTALEEMALANSHARGKQKNYLHRVYVEFKDKIQRPQEKNGI